MLIDSHCHIDYFEKQERADYVNNAIAAGVKYMLTIGTDRQSFNKIYDIVETFDNVYGAIGLHPHMAEEEGVFEIADLQNAIKKSKKIIGIGETGLDYSRVGYNKIIQQQNLLNHIVVAQETGMPLIIHNRDSNDDMTEILKTEYRKKNFSCVLHCFCGDKKMLTSMLDLGFYISASGIITFKNACDLQEVFKYVPFENLLVETDSPFLAPVPFRGKQNQSAFIVKTAKKLAEIKNVSFETIAKYTSNNFKNLFKLELS